MSIDVWEPGKKKESGVEEALLERFIEAGLMIEEGVDAAFLESHGIAEESQVMKLGLDAWQAAEIVPVEDIIALIRLFTLVEALPGWDAGSKSPVIALVGILKKRNAFTADIRKWIKKNTDNRYLPHGSAL